MQKFRQLFGSILAQRPVVIGMIHVLPLPGTARSSLMFVCVKKITLLHNKIYRQFLLPLYHVHVINDVIYSIGTPQHTLPIDRIIEKACNEAKLYKKYGLVRIVQWINKFVDG